MIAGVGYLVKNVQQVNKPKIDDVFLSLVKNDLNSFKEYVINGGSIYADLPLIDGKQMTIAEGIAYYDRLEFANFLRELNIPFIKQNANGDFVTIAFEKNNSKMLELILNQNIDYEFKYGDKSMSILHLASIGCQDQVVKKLVKDKKVDITQLTNDGETALTLAAQNECLKVLGFWKENGADFKAKNKNGTSALDIIKKKKGAEMEAFSESFEKRAPASTVTVAAVDNKRASFYKKREVPKEVQIDYSAIVEPKARPDEANDTAAFSEFSD